MMQGYSGDTLLETLMQILLSSSIIHERTHFFDKERQTHDSSPYFEH